MHNAPLPPTGSFQERLLFESILREKNEKYAVVTLFIRVLSAGLNLKADAVDGLLEEYKEELYQLRYNSKYKSSRQRRILDDVRKAAEQARMMRKIEQMTVSDDQFKEMLEKRKDV
jgi:hypothetical protein